MFQSTNNEIACDSFIWEIGLYLQYFWAKCQFYLEKELIEFIYRKSKYSAVEFEAT